MGAMSSTVLCGSVWQALRLDTSEGILNMSWLIAHVVTDILRGSCGESLKSRNKCRLRFGCPTKTPERPYPLKRTTLLRAKKICPSVDCSNPQPCPIHTRAPGWSIRPSPRRRRRRLSGWEEQKRAHRVLRRDNYICHVCGEQRATIADHVLPVAQGGSDDESNMKGICSRCNKKKTGKESHD